jgi:hypothetical protein
MNSGYRQIRKRLDIGDVYVDDSVQHRRFADELIPLERKAEALKELNIPCYSSQPTPLLIPCLPNSTRSGAPSDGN